MAILHQEQSWFDLNNNIDLTTKFQSQIEEVGLTIGNKVGYIISQLAQFISGFIFGFICCWKATLIMICVAPLLVISSLISMALIKKGMILSKQIWEQAKEIAEEILLNIKMVQSFANFDYELGRFYEKVEICYILDKNNSCKLGFSVGTMGIFMNLVLFICFTYGRTLIKRHYNFIKGRDFNGGDVFISGMCCLMSIIAFTIIF